jgi:hypothetical protein
MKRWMMNKLYIVAGSASQAHLYASILHLKDWAYVSEVFKLYGLRRPKVVFVGSYHERNDFEIITTHLRMIEADVLTESDVVNSEFYES